MGQNPLQFGMIIIKAIQYRPYCECSNNPLVNIVKNELSIIIFIIVGRYFNPIPWFLPNWFLFHIFPLVATSRKENNISKKVLDQTVNNINKKAEEKAHLKSLVVEKEKLAKESVLNETLLAYIDACVSTFWCFNILSHVVEVTPLIC